MSTSTISLAALGYAMALQHIGATTVLQDLGVSFFGVVIKQEQTLMPRLSDPD